MIERKHGRIIKLNRDGTGVVSSEGIEYAIQRDSISRRAHNSGRIHPNARVTFEVRHILDGRIRGERMKQRYNVEEIDMPDKDGRRIYGWQLWDDGASDNHKVVQTYKDRETAEEQCRRLNEEKP